MFLSLDKKTFLAVEKGASAGLGHDRRQVVRAQPYPTVNWSSGATSEGGIYTGGAPASSLRSGR